MEFLPKDLIDVIIEKLDYSTLLSVCQIDKYFYTIDLENILLRRQILNYPRITGSAMTHIIPSNMHDSDNLKYLHKIKTDLVKGDIIVTKHLMIFDGYKIITLDNNSIPKQFHVIEDNIPIHYWKTAYENNQNLDQSVYFNHKLVINQCIDNINENSFVGTYFIYDNTKYYIIFDHGIPIGHDPNLYIFDDFRKILLDGRDLFFDINSTYNRYGKMSNNTLYLDDYLCFRQ